MRKIYILFIFIFCLSTTRAQLTNSNFENWVIDTGSFGFTTYVPTDTFAYITPVGWTGLNSVTMSPALHSAQLVDSFYDTSLGRNCLYMKTETITVPTLGPLTLPGFVLNGNFGITLTEFFGITTLDPAVFVGSGTPYNQRLESFAVNMKYAPITNDSCLIWAELKKGNEIIADARFSISQALSNFTYVRQDFTYHSCDMPDTLIILLASSSPNLSEILSGQTGLSPGSQIWIDSVVLIPASDGFVINPIAGNVSATAYFNTPKTIDVLASDTDCNVLPLTVSIVNPPVWGTATVDSLQNIVYTPDSNFSGGDTLTYNVSNGSKSAAAFLFMNVFSTTSVNLINNYIYIYPNPAANAIKIENQSGLELQAQLFNANGQMVQDLKFSGPVNNIDISNLAPGVYLLKGHSNDNMAMFNKKLVVIR